MRRVHEDHLVDLAVVMADVKFDGCFPGCEQHLRNGGER